MTNALSMLLCRPRVPAWAPLALIATALLSLALFGCGGGKGSSTTDGDTDEDTGQSNATTNSVPDKPQGPRILEAWDGDLVELPDATAEEKAFRNAYADHAKAIGGMYPKNYRNDFALFARIIADPKPWIDARDQLNSMPTGRYGPFVKDSNAQLKNAIAEAIATANKVPDGRYIATANGYYKASLATPTEVTDGGPTPLFFKAMQRIYQGGQAAGNGNVSGARDAFDAALMTFSFGDNFPEILLSADKRDAYRSDAFPKRRAALVYPILYAAVAAKVQRALDAGKYGDAISAVSNIPEFAVNMLRDTKYSIPDVGEQIDEAKKMLVYDLGTRVSKVSGFDDIFIEQNSKFSSMQSMMDNPPTNAELDAALREAEAKLATIRSWGVEPLTKKYEMALGSWKGIVDFLKKKNDH